MVMLEKSSEVWTTEYLRVHTMYLEGVQGLLLAWSLRVTSYLCQGPGLSKGSKQKKGWRLLIYSWLYLSVLNRWKQEYAVFYRWKFRSRDRVILSLQRMLQKNKSRSTLGLLWRHTVIICTWNISNRKVITARPPKRHWKNTLGTLMEHALRRRMARWTASTMPRIDRGKVVT